MSEYKVGEFNQFGSYLLEVVREEKKSTIVKIIGVLRYPSQGLGKDNRNLPKFISQKPLPFGSIKEVPNQYLKDVSEEDFKDEIGSEDFYNYTVHVSLYVAQQTILRQIREKEAHKQCADYNLCKVLEVLSEHAKVFGLI